MVFVKTRSGRYIPAHQIVTLGVEEDKTASEGKMVHVSKVIVHLPEPLVPAVLGIFRDDTRAHAALKDLVEKLSHAERGVLIIDTEV